MKEDNRYGYKRYIFTKEVDSQKQESFSITAKESEQIEKEYEINDIIVNLNKALSKVGNITILEAINLLEKQTRFADELKNDIPWKQ